MDCRVGSCLRAFLAVAVIILLALPVMAQQSEAEKDGTAGPGGFQPAEFYAPFWLGDSSARSEIEIANLSEWSKDLQLELGSGLEGEKVLLSPFETYRVEAGRFARAGARFLGRSPASGDLAPTVGFWEMATLRTASPRNLVARVRTRDAGGNVILDLPFTEAKDVWSNDLVGVFWATDSVRDSLMTKNLSPGPVELEVTADIQGRSLTTRAVLEGKEERMFVLEEILPDVRLQRMAETASLPVGIRIHHKGPAGALLAWGLQADGVRPRLAFSFADPAKRFGNLLHHPAVVFGATADRGLPSQASLIPHLLLYNSSESGGSVRVSTSVSRDSAIKTHRQANSVYLRRHSVTVVALSSPSDGQSFSGIGSVMVEHDGDPRRISGWLVHLDRQNGIVSVASLIDPLARVSNSVYGTGISLSDRSTALAAATNITDRPAQFSLQLFYRNPNGAVETYMTPWASLGPREDVVIDLRSLRATPDMNGNLLPRDEDCATVRLLSSEMNAILAEFVNIDASFGRFGFSSHYAMEPGAYMSVDRSTGPGVAPQDFFCTGTTSCAYYDVLCETLPWYYAGWPYYCGPGKYACENIGAIFDVAGLTGVENCIRKCLQVNDNCVLILDPLQFSACINLLHVECYAECFFNPLCYVLGEGGDEGGCFPEECPEGEVWSEFDCGCVPAGSSPILLSERGNGLKLTNAVLGVNFDLNVDGFPERTSWTLPGGEAAFLGLDRNGNGRIDDGSELFGDHTAQPPSSEPNGFEALAVFDDPIEGGNGDGFVTAADAVFSRLVLWTDEDHDGVSQPSEMRSLVGSGVQAIRLRYHESRRTDPFGNQFRYFSRVEMERVPGSPATMHAVDVFFVGLPQQ